MLILSMTDYSRESEQAISWGKARPKDLINHKERRSQGTSENTSYVCPHFLPGKV